MAGTNPAMTKKRIIFHRDDAYRHSGGAERQPVDWMEQISDEQYRT